MFVVCGKLVLGFMYVGAFARFAWWLVFVVLFGVVC